MRVIPSVCSDATRSNAERRIFNLLSETSFGEGPPVGFHSLNLSRHDYKRVAELDFVIVTRTSLLVLEVKGGRVRRDDGVWTYTDRNGRDYRSSEGPFNQASSGMYALIGRLREQLGSVIDKLAIGFGVALPDIDFAEESVEWAPETVIDAAAVRSDDSFRCALENLDEYWQNKSRRASALTTRELDQVTRAIRPSFERIPTLKNRVDEIDAAMERLTDEQYDRLDLIESNRRIVCDGGAGTGKTFMAVEIARREAALGNRVVFVTSHRLQRSFVAARLGASTVEVVTPDSLPDSCDVLLVDEGQDLINVDQLADFDAMLAGGLEGGRWRMFLDRNRQSGLIGRLDQHSLDYLLNDCHATPATLTRNCRNTKPIAIETRMLTGSDLGRPMAGEGPAVVNYFFDTEASQQTALDAELERLSDNGVQPGDITILSPKQLAESVASRCRAARRRRLVDLSLAGPLDWPLRRTSFATIADFKGLENQFILITDITSLADQDDLNQLYVGMSRARAGLWMAFHSDLEPRIKQLSEVNLPLVLKDLKNA